MVKSHTHINDVISFGWRQGERGETHPLPTLLPIKPCLLYSTYTLEGFWYHTTPTCRLSKLAKLREREKEDEAT